MTTESSSTDPRLPGSVIPRHYTIELQPDIPSATFSGRVSIDIEISANTNEVVLNSADLDILEIALTVDGGEIATESRLDDATERLHIAPESRLSPGPANLTITFNGTLNDMLKGFYRSTFTDESGHEQVIATTQFQSTDARRAFPCWDEPDYKATFRSTLVVDPAHLAVSNTGVTSDTIDPDGRRRVEFAPTMLMSTYLVAYVVGPLEATEAVDVGGVPVRVVHRPGQGHLTEFALDVAEHALGYYEDYYGIPYPSDKLDLLAIPDFAFGAMENLGCVTFREVLLLVDPDGASQPELQRVADVINHELAHMWFGDLVTMKWWEGIWLNEAFATFMETACSDHYRPDWDVWTTFGRARAAAFHTDALRTTRPIEYPVVSPEDAEGMFDILTYEKGASVVRMLEQYLGEEPFRRGVHHYLTTHAHSNTETGDLWASLEEVTGEPVGAVMQSWIFQGGHPLVSLESTPHGVEIRQRHFTLDPDAADDRLWRVPLRIKTVDPSGSIRTRSVLLDGPRLLLTDGDRVLSANAQGSGFYRVSPSASMMEDLPPTVGDVLTAPERHSIVDDAWALTLAGHGQASDYLLLTERFASDTDLTVWQALSVGLAGLTRFVSANLEDSLRARLADLMRPAALRLGTRPADNDTDRTRELRATLVRAMGTIGNDPDVISQCRNLLDHPDVTLSAAAVHVVAHHGSDDDFQRFRDAWRNATDPQSEQRNLRALVDFPDPALVRSVLDSTLTGEVRSQDGPYLIRRALTNRHAGSVTWEFVEENWDAINDTFPSNSISRMLEGVVALDHEAQAARVSSFLESHPVPQGEMQISQHLESQRINVAARARETERFSAWLDS